MSMHNGIESVDTVVIGGGQAGLAAGYYLAKQGRDFVILDAGDNMHSASLGPLLRRVTDAAEVLGIIRRGHPGCVHVANANILVVEQP